MSDIIEIELRKLLPDAGGRDWISYLYLIRGASIISDRKKCPKEISIGVSDDTLQEKPITAM